MAVNAPALLQQNWNKFVANGVTQSCVYQEMDESSYEPGNSVVKPVISSHNLEIVFDNIKAYLVDDSTIKSIDQWAIFPALELPVAPKINDLIVDSSLREWEVKDVIADPAGAHYELRVRPIDG